jgi:hypothetical protein
LEFQLEEQHSSLPECQLATVPAADDTMKSQHYSQSKHLSTVLVSDWPSPISPREGSAEIDMSIMSPATANIHKLLLSFDERRILKSFYSFHIPR